MRLGSTLFLALFLLSMSACATRPPASDVDATKDFEANNDPYEPANRFFYKVNNGLDQYVLRPIAVAYRDVVPGAVRRPIHNALANVSSTVVFANDVLDAKPRRAGDTFMRFLINSTAGVGGFFDVASDWGYPSHDADFGQTLALWGLPDGPFLFLPVLGPSSPRDATGFGADIAIDPFTWVTFGGSHTLGYARFGLGAVDAREAVIDPLDQINKTALDPYATLRSLYRQRRASQIQALRDDKRATVPAWYPRP